jgi:hypothetical protein
MLSVKMGSASSDRVSTNFEEPSLQAHPVDSPLHFPQLYPLPNVPLPYQYEKRGRESFETAERGGKYFLPSVGL